ncbi:MAG: tRNA (adenosine(37)-N6)-threonylcarbamoyltransferase complex ATPase subunit type 1 TsaE [Pseudomonadales bacterium]
MSASGAQGSSNNKLFLADEQATLAIAKVLAATVKANTCIHLRGQLGSGKTSLVRGILRSLGYSGAVKSPTYTLVESYKLARFTVHHFDLYRLSDPEELELLGIRDYFDQQAVCLIEWPERGAKFLPPEDVTFELQVAEKSRYLVYHSNSTTGDSLVAALRNYK